MIIIPFLTPFKGAFFSPFVCRLYSFPRCHAGTIMVDHGNLQVEDQTIFVLHSIYREMLMYFHILLNQSPEFQNSSNPMIRSN